MWTVRKLKVAIADRTGAGKAAGYLLDPGASPRAFDPGGEGDSQPTAHWLGSEGALAELGLEPGQAVAKEDLELVLQGRDVDGAQARRPGSIHERTYDERGRLVRDAAGEPVLERRPGVASYDLTFSAPKSVSVLWSQADAAAKAAIERAMLESWNVATEHLIRSHDVVMQGRNESGERAYGPAQGFAASAALHVTARRARGELAPAPQLHVHGILVGLQRSDGKLAGINSSVLFGDAALEAGAYARTLLAQRLVEMGYEVESGTGRDGLYFELRGVPKGLNEALSGRTREIKAEASRLESELERELSNRERSLLALFTRAEKDGDLGPEQVAAWWRANCEEFGFGPEQAARLRGEPGFGLDRDQVRRELAEEVQRCMRKRGPAVSRAAARAIVVAAGSGRLPLAEAEAMVAELQRSGSLLALDQGRVTTPPIRAAELEVVAAVREAVGRPRVALSEQAIAAGEALANRALGEHSLDREQREAIAKLSGGAGWSVLSGRAGTGKTPVLQAVAEAHRHDGWEVVSCAIDWATAQKLGAEVGAEPMSINKVVRQAARGQIEIGPRTLILIDEAGKVGLKQWTQLSRLVGSSGARLLAVGHAGQLGAVELGGMFEEMVSREEVVNVATLREVRRHRHQWMRELQEAIDDGMGAEAVAIMRRERAITLYETRAEALQGMVESWFASEWRGESRATMIVQGANADVDEVNRIAQERRLQAGELSGPGVPAPERPYSFHAGDQVVLRAAAYRFEAGPGGEPEREIVNGTPGVVTAVDPAARQIEVSVHEAGHAPRSVWVDLERAAEEVGGPEGEPLPAPSWRLAYARHPNPAQGLTIASVNHLGGHWSQGQQGSYVGLSRQTHELHDHVDRESLGGGSSEECFAEYGRRLSRSRKREASIRFREDKGRQILTDRAAGRQLPAALAGSFEGKDRDPVPPPSLADRLDPLAAHRTALGERRLAWIERRAEHYAPAAARMHDELLRTELAAAREAFDSLDHEGALRALALRRDGAALGERRAKAERHAESLLSLAQEMRGAKQRAERQALEETAATQGRLAAEDAARMRALDAEEQALREQGVHPSSWMRDHGDQAARYLAAERERFARREASLEAEIEAALEDPPPQLRARLGPAPGKDEPERAEWEELARELECRRLIAAGELPAAEPSPREQRELGARIEALRGRRGLGPQLEVEGVVSELEGE